MESSAIAEAISRINRMEACFSSLQHAASIADDLSLREKLQVLTDYYENGLWLQDYELDEQGLLPKDLKRGVLSQDAVYDLLSRLTCATGAEAISHQ